ncbi:MAG: hypothetical protein ACI4EA_06080 [Candidatus Ornithomonoglobus sp.]
MSHICKNYEEMKRKLMEGYLEMSEINLEEAENSQTACNEALRVCEQNLTECEEE